MHFLARGRLVGFEPSQERRPPLIIHRCPRGRGAGTTRTPAKYRFVRCRMRHGGHLHSLDLALLGVDTPRARGDDPLWWDDISPPVDMLDERDAESGDLDCLSNEVPVVTSCEQLSHLLAN